MSVLMPVQYCFDYGSTVSLEIRKCEFSSLVLLFQDIVLTIWCPLRFQMNFRVDFIFLQKRDWDLIGIASILYIALGSIDIIIHQHRHLSVYLYLFNYF